MSIGSLGGVYATAAGSQMARTVGSDVERAKQDTVAQQRHVANERQADSAAGIAETDGKEHETHDRDADGRRPWEIGPPAQHAEQQGEPGTPATVLSKDASGSCGNELDLTG